MLEIRGRGAGIRVLLAPNAFKGTLTASQACAAMAAGVRRVWPAATLTKLAMSDGGDGFVEAVVGAQGGEVTRRRVPGPLLVGQVWAHVGRLTHSGKLTEVIELATTAGFTRISSRNARTACTSSTRGLGVLIEACLERSSERILVGVGGSCSTDGGTGLARALGYRFLRSDGVEVAEGGCGLVELDHIDAALADPRLTKVEMIAACDVMNPLLGPAGAATVYGPQKGAQPADVLRLEEGLRRLAEVARRDLGTGGLTDVPGAGAGGGTGFGLMAFCRAHAASGVDVVGAMCDLDGHIAAADLVITGEGRFDSQSLDGKVTGAVARRARCLGVPCFIVAGSSQPEARAAAKQWNAHVITLRSSTAVFEGRPPMRPTLIRGEADARLRRATVEACVSAAPLVRSGRRRHKSVGDCGGSQ